MAELTISIVNDCNRELVIECVKSIYYTKGALEVEIFVIDNASADGSADALAEAFPEVKLIRNSRKEGFSANHNKAIRLSSGEFVFILNDDTVILPGALTDMAAFMREHPEAGAVGAMLLNPDGTPQYTGKARPTLLAAAMVSLGFHRLFPANPITARYYGRKEAYTGPEEVESVNGAAMMVRREVFAKAGILDDGFFLFCEDVDWSIRMREAGFKLYFLPSARIIHYRGASTGGRRIVLIYHKSLFRFYRKHYAPKNFFLVNWLAYCGIAARLLLFLVYGGVRKKSA
ncbi:MAG TPA: glycosyltransferase family 2 protein [Nitrospirota bacterium]